MREFFASEILLNKNNKCIVSYIYRSIYTHKHIHKHTYIHIHNFGQPS